MKALLLWVLMVMTVGCGGCAGDSARSDAGPDGLDGLDGDHEVRKELEAHVYNIETAAWDLALSNDEKLVVACSGGFFGIFDAETLEAKARHTKDEQPIPGGYCRVSIIGEYAYIYYGTDPENMALFKLDLSSGAVAWTKKLQLPADSGGLYDSALAWRDKHFQGIVPLTGSDALFIHNLYKTYDQLDSWRGIAPLHINLETGEMSIENAYEITDAESVYVYGAFGGTKIFGNVSYRVAGSYLTDVYGFVLDLATKEFSKTPYHDFAASNRIDEARGKKLSVNLDWWVTDLATGVVEHLYSNPAGSGAMEDIAAVSGDRVVIVISGSRAPSLIMLLERDTGKLTGLVWLDDAAAMSVKANKRGDRVWVGSMNSISTIEIPPVESGGGE